MNPHTQEICGGVAVLILIAFFIALGMSVDQLALYLARAMP